jgi:hypothetical protein
MTTELEYNANTADSQRVEFCRSEFQSPPGCARVLNPQAVSRSAMTSVQPC